MAQHVLATGQTACFDALGRAIPCGGTGQDGAHRTGLRPEGARFSPDGAVVVDRLTGLAWSRNANPGDFPLTWEEALALVETMNRERAHGHDDWRLPNRIELASLIDFGAARPALPADAPFEKLEQTWYWTSTTAAISPAHAWYVEMSGGRMFFGRKSQFFLAWPVRGPGCGVLRASGQTDCFDSAGVRIPCAGTGQDGETRIGAAWPEPRFEMAGDGVRDRLTGLVWRRASRLTGAPVDWEGALQAVAALEAREGGGWRLPNINELESLVDCARHGPALPAGHPFVDLTDVYWSSTTSAYEPGWSFALYLNKGAIGVGHKRAASFDVWPVRG